MQAKDDALRTELAESQATVQQLNNLYNQSQNQRAVTAQANVQLQNQVNQVTNLFNERNRALRALQGRCDEFQRSAEANAAAARKQGEDLKSIQAGLASECDRLENELQKRDMLLAEARQLSTFRAAEIAALTAKVSMTTSIVNTAIDLMFLALKFQHQRPLNALG